MRDFGEKYKVLEKIHEFHGQLSVKLIIFIEYKAHMTFLLKDKESSMCGI